MAADTRGRCQLFALVGATALVAATMTALWAAVLVPSEPTSSPMSVVRDSLLPPVSAHALPSLPAGPVTARARLGFAGDVMQHRLQADDDFRRSYAAIAPLIRGFDAAIANLEFPVDVTPPVGPPAGSTRFNGSPRHLAALAAAGFDLLSLANNHALDQGEDGLRRTVHQLAAHGLTPVGAAETRADLDRAPAMVCVHGIRIAIRGYTFLPNVATDPAGRPLWPSVDAPVDVLDFGFWDDESRAQGVARARAHVAQARAAGADFLVAFVHWGSEWHLRPTGDQRRAARDLIDAGFDLVVGAHPHVLSGAEVYRGKLIAYSLGNLISDFRPLATRTGAVLEVDLARGQDRLVRVADFAFHPVLVRREGHVVHPISPGGTGEDAAAWELATQLLGVGVRAAGH